MKFTSVQFAGQKAYLLPIGDLHIGDRAFKGRGLRTLKGNLEWVRQHEDSARIVLMGDIFNVAGRDTKTSPFENDPEELEYAEDLFQPYVDLIIGAIRGNHEARIANAYGYDILKLFCKHLKIPYFGLGVVVKIQVGKRTEAGAGNRYWNTYLVACHHSRGGGGSLGNSVNAAKKLDNIVTGCDVHCVGHNHQLSQAAKTIYKATPTGLTEQRVIYVSCGSYLDYPDSYAEEAMLAPGKLGSPRIRFSGERNKHDCHVSI